MFLRKIVTELEVESAARAGMMMPMDASAAVPATND